MASQHTCRGRVLTRAAGARAAASAVFREQALMVMARVEQQWRAEATWTTTERARAAQSSAPAES